MRKPNLGQRVRRLLEATAARTPRSRTQASSLCPFFRVNVALTN